MTLDLIKYAFVGGEIADSYYGRADLEKFDLALAVAENWYVDYSGGISTSPGLEVGDYIKDPDYPTKFVPFKFSNSPTNTYIILFGKDYIRFIQNNAYILEDGFSIVSITEASPAVVTTTLPHHFSEGDWIKFPSTGEMTQLTGRTFIVVNVTEFTFELQDVFGENIDSTNYTTYVSGGEVSRVYTLASIYDYDDLSSLKATQVRDVIRLTHPQYPVYNLERFSSNNWTISEETLTRQLEIPSNVNVATLNSGSYSVGYVITQIDSEGIESLPSDYAFSTDVIDFMANGNGGAKITWTACAGAKYYKIYRTRIVRADAGVSRSFQTGLIGQSKGAIFIDSGITPDFAQTPPQGTNPFAPRSITSIDVTFGGLGYTESSSITITDSAPNAGGFIGYPILNPSTGAIVGVMILDGGHDYSNPVITVSGGTSAASFTTTVGEAVGTYPSVASVFQQRQIYAAPDNFPLTIYGSRPNKLSDFTVSDILLANDSYEHTVDSEDLSPIRHLIPTRGGMLVGSAFGIWLLSGSSGYAITATDVQAVPQVYKGMTDVVPIRIGSDILYCEDPSGYVMQLAYNDVIKLYAPTDISILANHLFQRGKRITHWTYADTPFKSVFAVRDDGTLLQFVLIKDQNVYAWNRRTTNGEFLDVASINIGTTHEVYVTVRRKLNGKFVKFFERLDQRQFRHEEDSFCVDCGLKLEATYGSYDLQIDAISGDGVSAVANGPQFVSGDVDKIIRFGGGKMRIASFVNEYEVTVDIVRDIEDVVHGTTRPILARAGAWTVDAEVTTISGLDHLEGEAVAVLADGKVVTGKTVSAGAITLPEAASRVVVGLAYTCTARNLPLTVDGATIEHKRQRVVALALRVKDTKGIKVGNSLESLYDLADRTNELYGEPTAMSSGIKYVMVDPIWKDEAQSYFVQDLPLPATILGYVVETEVEDVKE